MSQIYIAIIRTESADTYAWPYSKKPSREQVLKDLIEYEGADEDDLDWYMNTSSVRIVEEQIR